MNALAELSSKYAITIHPDGAMFVRINDQWVQVDEISPA